MDRIGPPPDPSWDSSQPEIHYHAHEWSRLVDTSTPEKIRLTSTGKNHWSFWRDGDAWAVLKWTAIVLFFGAAVFAGELQRLFS